MKQPDAEARREYMELEHDIPTEVQIIGTKRTVKLRGMKPYTIERLTMLWMEREMAELDSTAKTLKSMCSDPYFSIKEACLMVLNSYWKIRLFYPIMWRWWAYVRQYTESQVTSIIVEGKKKLPLMPHWRNMAYSTDMRTDWMKQTAKEAEQYQAELLSVAKQLSSKNSRSTDTQEDSSSGSSQSEAGATVAS